MIIETTVTKDHWLELMKHIEKRLETRKARRKKPGEWALDIGIGGVFLVVFIVFGQDFHWKTAGITSLFYLWIFVGWLIYEARKRQPIVPPDDGVTLGPRRYELSETGIDYRNKYLHWCASWNIVSDIYETDRLLVLAIEDIDGLIFPKADIEDLGTFEQIVHQYRTSTK